MCDCEKIKNTDDYVVAWRCWYDNGSANPSEFNSIEHCICDLPEHGFQAMRLWYSDGTSRYITGHDYYYFSNHEAGTIFGQTNREEDLKKYPDAIIKYGKYIPDGLMKKIDSLMTNSKNPLDNAN